MGIGRRATILGLLPTYSHQLAASSWGCQNTKQRYVFIKFDYKSRDMQRIANMTTMNSKEKMAHVRHMYDNWIWCQISYFCYFARAILNLVLTNWIAEFAVVILLNIMFEMSNRIQYITLLLHSSLLKVSLDTMIPTTTSLPTSRPSTPTSWQPTSILRSTQLQWMTPPNMLAQSSILKPA